MVNSQPALSQVLVKEENGQKTFYVYGLGLIGQEVNGEYTSYHFDFRGSTVALTDKNAQIVEEYQYSPYGLLLSGDSSKTPFLFNGKYGVMTDSNNLYYMRARFYSPEIKRFINQDILLGGIGDGQTLNRYAYVTGKPIIFVDPFGLVPIPPDYIWDTPIIIYDIYYGITTGDWIPLGIDFPLAVAPGVFAGAGMLSYDIKAVKPMSLSEAKQLISMWDKASYNNISHSIRDHADRHGFGVEFAKYLRKAANFNKKDAHKTLLDNGATRWNRKNGEYIIERNGKIVSYGVN